MIVKALLPICKYSNNMFSDKRGLRVSDIGYIIPIVILYNP